MPDPLPESFTPFQTRQERNWTPILIGIGIVIVVLAAIVIFSRQGRKSPSAPDPYAQKLQISGMQISRANNFVGATVTYLDCRVANTGDKTVTGARAELTFRNTLNEVVQKEVVPIRVLHTNKLGGYEDAVDLSLAPLSPGQTQAIRLVLEHVSNDWNRSFPDLRFVNLSY
ncbi:MAG: hypothetical protein ABSD96_16230, partial [Candidatus Korobacteraceae bacterium]